MNDIKDVTRERIGWLFLQLVNNGTVGYLPVKEDGIYFITVPTWFVPVALYLHKIKKFLFGER